MSCNSRERKIDGLSLLVKFGDYFDYVVFCAIISSTIIGNSQPTFTCSKTTIEYQKDTESIQS